MIRETDETVKGAGKVEMLHPGVLMFICGRHIENRVMAAVGEAGFGDITLAQARLAARIAPDGTRLTELAEAAQVTKQTAGFLVDQLERAGYVERAPDPADARAKLVRFAPKGEAVVACARRVEQEVAEEWQAHLGREAYQSMQSALSSLRELTDPYAQDAG